MCFHTPKSVCWIRCVNLGQQHTTTDWVLTRNACNFRKKYFSRTVSRAWNRPPKPKVENRKSWHRTGKMKFLTLNPCFDRKQSFENWKHKSPNEIWHTTQPHTPDNTVEHGVANRLAEFGVGGVRCLYYTMSIKIVNTSQNCSVARRIFWAINH